MIYLRKHERVEVRIGDEWIAGTVTWCGLFGTYDIRTDTGRTIRNFQPTEDNIK